LNRSAPTTVRDLNGIRSDMEKIARTSSDGAQRNMARTVSSAFMDGMDRIPEIAGTPAQNVPRGYRPLPTDPPWMSQPLHTIPAVQPDPEISAAYQAARNYTRQMRTLFGTDDLKGVLSKNDSGIYHKDASEGAKAFFNFSRGTVEGPQSLSDVSNFMRKVPAGAKVSANIKDAARSYLASAIRDAGRTNEGQNLNAKTLQDFIRKNAPSLVKTGILEKPQVQALAELSNYTDMLRRPEQLMRSVNSETAMRQARSKTFIDEIMAPWLKRWSVVAGGLGALGFHGEAMHGGIGLLASHQLMGHVEKVEGAMRSLKAEALFDPKMAQALMTKASPANNALLSPRARALIGQARTAIVNEAIQLEAPAKVDSN